MGGEPPPRTRSSCPPSNQSFRAVRYAHRRPVGLARPTAKPAGDPEMPAFAILIVTLQSSASSNAQLASISFVVTVPRETPGDARQANTPWMRPSMPRARRHAHLPIAAHTPRRRFGGFRYNPAERSLLEFVTQCRVWVCVVPHPQILTWMIHQLVAQDVHGRDQRSGCE